MKRKPRNAQTDRLTNARLFFLGYCVLGVRASSLRWLSASSFRVMLCRCWRPRWAIWCSSKRSGSSVSTRCSFEAPVPTSSLAIRDFATRIAARCGNALLLFTLLFGYAAFACWFYHLLRVKMMWCIRTVTVPAAKHAPLASWHTRYANNGNSPYTGTQVDSMCSTLYSDCRAKSTALDTMCKLASGNVYWNGLSMAEQTKGFQSFREDVLRKAQSAFLYRHVLPPIVLIAPEIVARRLTPCAAQHRHCANRLRVGAENTLAEPVCGGGEERQPSVSSFSFQHYCSSHTFCRASFFLTIIIMSTLVYAPFMHSVFLTSPINVKYIGMAIPVIPVMVLPDFSLCLFLAPDACFCCRYL
jgi:hypothetical protein